MSENMEKINKLYLCRDLISAGGGKDSISRLHSSGKQSARERIVEVLDENSFVEFGMFVKARATDFNAASKETPADGVITGYGTVDGRLVFIYSQDCTVLGGSVGEMHAKKICSVYEQALKMGVPVIGILDSAGMRVQEGVDALDAYGKIYKSMAGASGTIPQITVILGDCMGSGAFIPALSDFVFMVDKNAKLFMSSPHTLPGQEGKTAGFDSVGSAKVLEQESGIVHFVYETEESCLAGVKTLLDFLPSNNMEDAPFFSVADDINRTDEILNEIITTDMDEEIDINQIITILADNGQFLEVHKNYGVKMVLGFIRMNGYTIGIIGNKNSLLCNQCITKSTQFINFCDAFNIPILSLTDVGGYVPMVEQGNLIKNTAKLINVFVNATVPKINVILRKGYGNTYLVMNSKHIGADVVFAWPTAKVALMDAEAAITIMYADELKNAENANSFKSERIAEYEEMQSSCYTAAGRGYIDDIIEPAVTRKRVIAVLEMLSSKREAKPTKKHASITF